MQYGSTGGSDPASCTDLGRGNRHTRATPRAVFLAPCGEGMPNSYSRGERSLGVVEMKLSGALALRGQSPWFSVDWASMSFYNMLGAMSSVFAWRGRRRPSASSALGVSRVQTGRTRRRAFPRLVAETPMIIAHPGVVRCCRRALQSPYRRVTPTSWRWASRLASVLAQQFLQHLLNYLGLFRILTSRDFGQLGPTTHVESRHIQNFYLEEPTVAEARRDGSLRIRRELGRLSTVDSATISAKGSMDHQIETSGRRIRTFCSSTVPVELSQRSSDATDVRWDGATMTSGGAGEQWKIPE
ncbi:LOW QUALITY PROTEIN: hypothetical protein M513_13421 [Trichuris suis]|uniref:Uncharacterized protein n=1 Tax=Trichuris suis TaxID=68888 RepID=A0A085LL53_9BILA|nr:LOW QUALITY PROTEIN: hypothetical protein M513_13421 [Trichuris suis]